MENEKADGGQQRIHTLIHSLAERSEQINFIYNLAANRFEYLNPAAKSLFQLSGDELATAAIISKIHPEDIGYLTIIYNEFIGGGISTDAEFRLVLAGGQEKWLSVSAYQVNEGGKTQLVGYGQDITRFKDHFKTLNKFASKKNAMLNILSHDLSGPLGSIQLITEMLTKKEQLQNEKEVIDMIGWINSISKKSVKLIQEFVKQEFLESSEAALIKRRTNLVETFKIAVDEYNSSEEELKQEIVCECNTNAVFVNLDETKFMQVIHNLMSNSIKFTPDGGRIVLRLEEREHSVLISVSDTGIGIPEKFHEELFDKFTSARRKGLKGEPTVGLGMSLIKIIVEWHNGRIWFNSEENEGSTFYIELPKSG